MSETSVYARVHPASSVSRVPFFFLYRGTWVREANGARLRLYSTDDVDMDVWWAAVRVLRNHAAGARVQRIMLWDPAQHTATPLNSYVTLRDLFRMHVIVYVR